MSHKIPSVLVIGSGTIGKVFIRGLQQCYPTSYLAVAKRNPNDTEELQKIFNLTADSVEHLITTTTWDVVIMAVKPQDSAMVAQVCGKALADSLIISVMAGVTLERLHHLFKSKRIIRCMPNTPATIGQGMTVWLDQPHLTPSDRLFAETLFNSFGQTMAVPSDDWIDRATAISGSGPAYVFACIEALTAAAEQLGWSPQQAQQLIQQTFQGSLGLLKHSQQSPAQLRDSVTSKGGTTAAALHELNIDDFKKRWIMAVQAAYHRAQAMH